MGGTSSTVQESKQSGRSDDEIIDLVMPLYYTKDPLTKAERDAAVSAWKMIMNDRSDHFKFMKDNKAPDFLEHNNCMELFYFTFYTRLFDVHPIAKMLFHRALNKQGTFFVRFISMAITQLDDPDKWAKTFNNLTDIHNKMGVKAIEFGIVGDVLIFSIQKCVGPLVYNEVAHNGWAKIYSRMLDVIVPNAVMFELNQKNDAVEAANKRFKDTSKAAAVVSTMAHNDKKESIFNDRNSSNSAVASIYQPHRPAAAEATQQHQESIVKPSKPSAAVEGARIGIKAAPCAITGSHSSSNNKDNEQRAATPTEEEDEKRDEEDERRAKHIRSSDKALKENSNKAMRNVEVFGAAARR